MVELLVRIFLSLEWLTGFQDLSQIQEKGYMQKETTPKLLQLVCHHYLLKTLVLMRWVLLEAMCA